MSGALAGIRVADFSRVIAGPYGTQTLADLGADVVKIEHPVGGDDARAYAPPDMGGGLTPVYVAFNRNKRSVALDLATEPGRRTARALIDKADVVVENFSTGVMAKYGLDWETVGPANPRLVYCSVSAYGRSGPFAGRPGYDPVVQSESGFMSMNGEPDREPLRSGSPMMDLTTGITAAQAVLAALFGRARTGKGQFVEVALFDTGFSTTAQAALAYMAGGKCPTRPGNSSEFTQPTGAYATRDGTLLLTIAGERTWRALCGMLGRAELADDPRFARNAQRVANRAELRALLEGVFAGDDTAGWLERMRAAGVPAGEIREIGTALGSPEATARGLVGTLPHERAGAVPNLRSPIRLSRTPVIERTAAPDLGRHTEEALADWLGYGPDDIAALRAAGATR